MYKTRSKGPDNRPGSRPPSPRAGWIVAAFAVTVGVTLVSCSSRGSALPMDRSFLTGDPCEPPCWHGLEPGVSTADNAYAVLERLPFVESDSLRETPATNGEGEDLVLLRFHCPGRHDRTFCGGVELSRGTVRQIWISPLYTLTLMQAVERLSTPTSMSFIPEVDTGFCTISLYWSERRMAVKSDLTVLCPSEREVAEGARPSPEALVGTIVYGIETPKIAPQTFRQGDVFVPWRGFLED